MEDKKGVYIAAIAALGLVISSWVFGSYWYSARLVNDSISVTGSARQRITSDIAKWEANFSVSVGMFGLQEGNESIKKQMEEIKVFLKKNGIAESEISFSPVSVSADFYDKVISKEDPNIVTQVQSGYTLRTSFTVESKNLDALVKASGSATDLVSSGIILNAYSVEFYYSKLADLKVEMLAEATKDARARAEKIADNTKSSLGKLKSAQMGVMQITAPNSTDLSSEGYYDTSSKEKEITAIVRADFGIK
jgi:hypothetical protein